MLLHVCFSINLHQLLWFLIVLLGALVALYEEAEKPNNAAEFVRRFMGASGPDSAEIETLKNELMVTNEKLDELQRENEVLKEKLQKYENGQ
jgi:cell shape-determining protein MreC